MSDVDGNLLKQLHIEGELRESETRRTIPRAWMVAVAVIVAAAAGFAWWYFAVRAIEVRTATAVAADARSGGGAAVLQATGYVTARRKATVASQITGTLTEVSIEEGDFVKKGQVLARLEDSALRASLDAAQAGVQVADAQVAQAQAQLVQSQADVRRQDALAESGVVSPQGAEQARTAAATAAAQLEARRREAEQARAQFSQAKVNFDYTFVRAPFSGVVTEKAAQVGEIISPLSAGGGFTRTGVGTIVDMDSLEVDVDVNEAYIGQVSPAMPAQAVLDAYPDWKIPAHVIAIVPTADRGKATVKVRVALEQKDARLVPDIGVRVSFIGRQESATPQPRQGVLVPAVALTQRDGRTVLFVAVDGKARQREVAAAPQDVGAMKWLPQGVAVDESVIVSPPPSLYDGARVRIGHDSR